MNTDAERAEHEMFVEYGVSVKSRRRALGLTQAELARRLGTSVSSLSKMECGRSHPNPPFKLVIENELSRDV